MTKINQNQQKILSVLSGRENLSSSEIYEELQKGGEDVSLVTIKRRLSEMVTLGFIKVHGAGPSTNYQISSTGRINSDIDAKAYCAVDPDNRYGSNKFNFDLLQDFSVDFFSKEETKKLEVATKEYQKRSSGISETIQKKELERLVIELSWKSSKIEGNTYTLLDTEKLIRGHKEATGHSKSEAQMILNHKEAFDFVYSKRDDFKKLDKAKLEHLHKLLVKNLNVNFGFRKKLVGIVGSKYKPLDNIYQIDDAINELFIAISKINNFYAKAVVAFLGLSYIQPFEDGNKRTSRLLCNAILMAYNLAPLSYRSLSENDYKEALIVFYEINSVIPFKKIFIEQYLFATQNYAIKL